TSITSWPRATSGAGVVPPHPRMRNVASHLIGAATIPRLSVRETDREIDLQIARFEPVAKIEAEQRQHDLAQEQPRADADRVLERLQPAGVAARQVAPLVIVGREERRVRRIPEPEAAKAEPVDLEQRERVLDVDERLEVAAELVVQPAAHRRAAGQELLLERHVVADVEMRLQHE